MENFLEKMMKHKFEQAYKEKDYKIKYENKIYKTRGLGSLNKRTFRATSEWDLWLQVYLYILKVNPTIANEEFYNEKKFNLLLRSNRSTNNKLYDEYVENVNDGCMNETTAMPREEFFYERAVYDYALGFVEEQGIHNSEIWAIVK
jgi:hypothetical protein